MTRDQIFWAVLGVLALALVSVAFIWGGSVRAEVRAERGRWEDLSNQYSRLWAGRKKIPNQETIKEWDDFREWVGTQAQDVVAFFERRDKVLERHIVQGVPEPSPGDFKAEYNSLRSESVRHLGRLKQMRTWNPEAVFRLYPWSIGDASPEPDEYRNVRKDLWIRRYLVLGVLPRNGVQEVSNLAVFPARDIAGTEFKAIPVRITCTLASENLMKLLRSLLTIHEGDPEKLFLIMRELSVKKAKGAGGKSSPPVAVDVLVDIIDYEPKGS